jgi:hypothetical protein
MKPQHVQLRRGGKKRSAQAPQRKAVEGRAPGSRNSDSSLEAQADNAADGAVRHRPNVSRGLTEAPPAKYDAPASVGREMVREVRTDLEATFGAELAAVRVHDDAAAHTSARAEEAQAFTAGRDVYFAQGKYAPNSTEGLRLLAHEIAHVLQQTGRRLSSTLVEATEREGAGDVQVRAPGRPS